MRFLLTATIVFLLTFGVSTLQAKDLVLTQDNTLVLSGSIQPGLTAILMEEATKLDANLKSGYPMYLFLYTPGGSIQSGLILIEFLKGLNRPIHTVSLFSASMGWQIQQHLGTRYVMGYSVLMSHKARGGFYGSFGGGLSQLDARYGLWLRRIDLMDKVTVKRTKGKQTLTSYRAAYAHELWLNGSEAVEQGYADKIIVAKCNSSLSGTKKTVINLGFFKVILVFSKCPIKTAPISIKASLFTNQGEMGLDDFLNKNGQFGKTCGQEPILQPYYKDEIEPISVSQPKDELCAQDPTLTLKKIQKVIEEQRKIFTRDLKDYIEYSY